MLSDLLYRLRALFRRSTVDRELHDELQFHLERQADHDARAGVPRDEALRRARHELGGVEQLKEACRDTRGVGPIERGLQDLGHAWRVLRKHPVFTATVVMTLALGIGATTTMFAVVDGIVLRSLPYPRADRLVQIGAWFGDVRVSSLSAPDAFDLATRAKTLAGLAATKPQSLDLVGDGPPERLEAGAVSASFFAILGARPLLGQTFTADLDRPGSTAVVVLSHGLWRRRFGGDPSVLGRRLILNDVHYTVIGVMPADFRGPDALSQRDAVLWIPAGRVEASVTNRGDASWGVIARLADGADLAAATAEVQAIAKALTQEQPQEDARTFWMSSLAARTVGDAGGQLWLIFGAVSLLWVIACANMANLFLVRATERTREMAIRSALGAGRRRIARQLLAESGLCAVLGGTIGAGLAYLGMALLRAFGPRDLPRLAEVAVDARVLWFTLGLSAVAGIGFGLVPALDAMRPAPAGGLRVDAGALTGSRGRMRLRGALVVAQTALALVLVVGAALLAHSLLRLSRVNPGFDPRNAVWLEVALPARTYPTPATRIAFFDDLLARVRGANGVIDASAIVGRPLGGGTSVSSVFPEGPLPADGAQTPRVPFHSVMPGYFATLKIPLVDGRDLRSSDDTSAPRVAIVSRAFADRFWPNERAVDKRFWMGRVAADAPLTTIVGVVEDVRQYGLAIAPIPMVYRPFAQAPRTSLGVVARHDGRAPAALLQDLRRMAWTIDPGLPLDAYGTMDAHVRASIAEPRFRAIALSTFSAIATALAFVGLYGTLSFVVRTRRRELGIRMVLGADAREVRRLIMLRGARLAGVGIVLGAAVAIVASRVLASMVFGITTTDAPTFAVAILGMSVVACLASWIPASRAAATDPVATLRAE